MATQIFAQDGMEFFEGSWADAVSKAEAEDKLIFLDAYTTWCGPCKLMAKKIFPREDVGSYFNERFVNMKIDMEKGEGIELARKFNVLVYPTLLFVNGSGELVHRSAGYHTVPQFLELGEKALNPATQIASLEKRYNAGDRDPAFLQDYINARFEIQDGSHITIAEEYLATQADWSSPEHMDMIFNYTNHADSPMFDYIVKERAGFNGIFGGDKVDDKLQQIVNNTLFNSKEPPSLDKVDGMFQLINPDKAGALSSKYRMMHYRNQGDRDGYANAAVNYLKKYDAENWDELNEIGWTFYQVVDDKKLLKKATKWVKQSVKMDNNFYNNDTLAALYYKLGKKKKALKYADTAIGMAKAVGEDYTATSKLKEQILAL